MSSWPTDAQSFPLHAQDQSELAPHYRVWYILIGEGIRLQAPTETGRLMTPRKHRGLFYCPDAALAEGAL